MVDITSLEGMHIACRSKCALGKVSDSAYSLQQYTGGGGVVTMVEHSTFVIFRRRFVVHPTEST